MSSSETFAAGWLDGADALQKLSGEALEGLQELSGFVKKLSKLEAKFGVELSQLITKDGKKLLERDALHGTTREFVSVFLGQLGDVAKSHSQYSETLANQVSSELDALYKDETKKRTAIVQDHVKVDKTWKTQLAVMKKAEQAYKDSASVADAVHDLFIQGKADADMKPKELAKLSGRSQKVSETRDKAQQDYRRVLQFTNQQKTLYWCQDIPLLLRRYQDAEAERIDHIKLVVDKLGHAFLFKPPIYQSSAEALIRAADAIDKTSDVKALVSKFGSGFAAPADYPEQHFGADTSSSATAVIDTSAAVVSPASPKSAPAPKSSGRTPPPLPSKNSTTSTKDVLARCGGLASLAAGLSDGEKTAKLTEQLDALEKATAYESKAKTGLEALIGFYKDDPTAKKNAEVEVAGSANNLKLLAERVQAIEAELKSLAGNSDEKRDRGGSTAATPSNDLPTLERLQALFDYEATSDQELSFKAGEWLDIKQKDGSGWWWAVLGGKSGFVPNSYVVEDAE